MARASSSRKNGLPSACRMMRAATGSGTGADSIIEPTMDALSPGVSELEGNLGRERPVQPGQGVAGAIREEHQDGDALEPLDE